MYLRTFLCRFVVSSIPHLLRRSLVESDKSIVTERGVENYFELSDEQFIQREFLIVCDWSRKTWMSYVIHSSLAAYIRRLRVEGSQLQAGEHCSELKEEAAEVKKGWEED